MISRRQAMLGSAGLIGALAGGAFGANPTNAATPDTFAALRLSHRNPYGACVNLDPLLNEPEYRIALETYCQQVTPEYGLVWDICVLPAISSISTSPTKYWPLPKRTR